MSTLYDILEVSPQASDEEIKKSYRRLAMVYHPDKNKMPGAHERFLIIQDAYELLSDKYKRRQYDMILAYRQVNNNFEQQSQQNQYNTEQQQRAQEEARRAQQKAREAEAARQKKEQEENYQKRRAAAAALKKLNDARLFVMLKAVNYVFLCIGFLFILDGLLPKEIEKNQYVTHVHYRNFHTEDYSFKTESEEDEYDFTKNYLDLETTPIFGFVSSIKGLNSKPLANPIITDSGPSKILFINIITLILGLILEFYWSKNAKNELLVPAISFIIFLVIVIDFFMTFEVMA